jgi:FkbM family methyltransferase
VIDFGRDGVHSAVKAIFPRWMLRLARMGLTYIHRVGNWFGICLRINGKSSKDRMVLLRSVLIAPLDSGRDLLKWRDPLLVSDCSVFVSSVGEFELRGRCDDLWHVYYNTNCPVERVVRRLLRPGDVFIDGGANIGVYTLIAAQLVGEKGKVVCVEMIPETSERLERTVTLNGLTNVRVVVGALSEVSGLKLPAVVPQGKFGQARLDLSANGCVSEGVTVETVTLDSLSKEFDRVRLLKLDVEGAELSALMGARDLLTKIDAIVYESLWHSSKAKSSVDELLMGLGFCLADVDGNNRLALRPGVLL